MWTIFIKAISDNIIQRKVFKSDFFEFKNALALALDIRFTLLKPIYVTST